MSLNQFFGQVRNDINDTLLSALSNIPVSAVPYMSTMNQSLSTGSSPHFLGLTSNDIHATSITTGSLQVLNTSTLNMFATSITSGSLLLTTGKLLITTSNSSATLGNNILTGGDTDFTSSTGNWTTGTGGWSITGGRYVHTANATTAVYTPSLSTGGRYKIVMKVSTTTIGSVYPSIGNSSGRPIGKILQTDYIEVDYILATGVSPQLKLVPDTTWEGSFDYIQVFLITAGSASMVLYPTGGSYYIDVNASDGLTPAIGYDACKYSCTGNKSSVAIGTEALHYSEGINNVGIGSQALLYSTGDHNTAVGYNASYFNTMGKYNTGIGAETLLVNSLGSYHTAVGGGALRNLKEGTGNVALGYASGTVPVYGSNNVFLGYGSDANAVDTTNAIALGYGVFASSNEIVIGNSNHVSTSIDGQKVKFLNATADSTSTSSGAIQIVGGLSVQKSMFSDGLIRFGHTADSTSSSSGSVVLTGGISVQKRINSDGLIRFGHTADSTSSSSGSVVLTGGLGIQKSLHVGNSLNAPSSTIGNLLITSSITTGNLLITSGQLLLSIGTVPIYTIKTLREREGSSAISHSYKAYLNNGSNSDLNIGFEVGMEGANSDNESAFLAHKYLTGNSNADSYGTLGTYNQNDCITFKKGSYIGINTAPSTSYTMYVNGNSLIGSVDDATTTSSGSLQILGGASIQKTLYIGNSLVIGGVSGTNPVSSGFLCRGGYSITVSALSPTTYNICDTALFGTGTYFMSISTGFDGWGWVGGFFISTSNVVTLGTPILSNNLNLTITGAGNKVITIAQVSGATGKVYTAFIQKFVSP